MLYILPSSVMLLSDSEALKEAVEALDAKLEEFATKVMSA
jgi:hypothetical protein